MVTRLHFRPANQGDEIARRMITRPKFRVTEVDRSVDLNTLQYHQQICSIVRVGGCITQDKVGHFLFSGVDKNFVVRKSNYWEPHPFVYLNEDRMFKVLAESDTFQIFELGFLIGCIFEVSPKHETHCRMVRNFILKMATEVRCHNYATKPLAPKLGNKVLKTNRVAEKESFVLYEEFTRRIQEQLASGADLIQMDAELNRPIEVVKHSGFVIRKDKVTGMASRNAITKASTAGKTMAPNTSRDIVFLRTSERQSIKRHSQQYKEDIMDAYTKCYPGSSRIRNRSMENSMKLAIDFENAVEIDKTDSNLQIDPSQIRVLKNLPEVSQEQHDKKIFSFKVNSFVERDYARRTMQHIQRLEKKAKDEKTKEIRASSTSNAYANSSQNSSNERFDVGTTELDVAVSRPSNRLSEQ